MLARVNAARQRLAKAPAILKRFRQSVLAAACSGRLTAGWRDSQENIESAADLLERTAKRATGTTSIDAELFEIPIEWCWVAIRTLMDSREPFCYGVVQPGADDENGIPLIRAGDLEGGTVNLSALRRIPVEVDREYKRSKVTGGELLVTVVGAGIGAAAIIPDKCKGFNIARAVAKIPVRDFSSKYVLAWFQSSTANTWMKNAAREVARPTLNLEQLETLPVPLPPLPEQHEIVRRVEALFKLADAVEKRVQGATARAERLTQAILAKAFRGELVPTEAELARREGRDYEPASALLERIKKQSTDGTDSTDLKKRKKQRGR